MTCTPGTAVAWTFSAGAAPRPRPRSCSAPRRPSPGHAASGRRSPGPSSTRAGTPRRRTISALIVEASPSDDYAHFGLGLALARTGNHAAAAEYLALAAAMRPDATHYTEALRSVRATLRARKTAQGGAE